MKTPIDIERLLQWALREELPKGSAVAASAWDLITQYGMLGTRVQTSGQGSPDGLGFVDGAPHDDALIVAAAVRALPTEARFEDRDHAAKLFGEFAPIASEAIVALSVAIFNPRAIVISCAALSRRPPWNFETPTPRQMFVDFRDPQGDLRTRPLVHGLDVSGAEVAISPNRGRAVVRDGLYDYARAPRSPLAWGDPDLISIGDARAEYFAWHAALGGLVNDLAGRLEQYEPIASAARPMPWLTGQAPDPRVLRDGRSAGAALPLAPKRKAPGRPIESAIESDMRAGRARAAADRRRAKMASCADETRQSA